MGGLFGGGSNQNTTQQAFTNTSSTTNNAQTTNVSVNQSGLTPAQVSNLVQQGTAPSQQLTNVLAGAGQGLAAGSIFVWVVVLLLFAGVIFRGR